MERDVFLSRLSARLTPGRRSAPTLEIPPLPPLAGHGESPADLFIARAVEAGAHVHRAETRAAAYGAVARLLEQDGHDTIACPSTLGFPAAEGRGATDPRKASFGLSEADWGIAATGSVVLRHQGVMGRQFSLVPPSVGILLAASRLVPDLATALRLIAEAPPPACITFMTGVSHSGDIAGTMCTGVHGPGSVHIWLLGDE